MRKVKAKIYREVLDIAEVTLDDDGYIMDYTVLENDDVLDIRMIKKLGEC